MVTQQPIVVVLAVIAGCVVGGTVFALCPEKPGWAKRRDRVRGRTEPRESQQHRRRDDPDGRGEVRFYDEPAARLWLAIIIGLWGVLGGVTAFVLPSWLDLVSAQGTTVRFLVGLGVVVLFLAVVILPRRFSPPQEFPLWRHKDRITLLFAVGCIPLGMTMLGMPLVASGGRDALTAGCRTLPDDLNAMLGLRQQLVTYLGCAALIISVTIVAIAALGRALGTLQGAGSAADLGTPPVILYGAFFSGLLALIFIPSYIDLQSSGWQMVDGALRCARLSPPAEDWFTRRSQLTEVLALSVSWSATFVSALGVLAPVGSSYLTKFLRVDLGSE